VTLSDPPTATQVAAPDVDPLARYTIRMRRARRRYAVVLAALAVAVTAVAALVWSRGEITHTTLRTAPHPAPPIPLRAPATSVRPAWRSADHTATGIPYSGGSVVTYDEHAVHGRDGTTGAVTWSYSRSDRTVCSVVQVGGVSVALYRLHGDCTEVTALDSQTGARKWTRTLDEDNQLVRGTPATQATVSSVLVVSQKVIYDLDPTNGYDRWVYSPDGCTVHRAVMGTSGVLISQTCAPTVSCKDRTICGPGIQLLLRDPNQGHDDKSDSKNPDRVTWNHLGSADLPVSADQVISAWNPTTGSLEAFQATGGATHPLALRPAPPGLAALLAPGGLGSAGTDTAQLIHLGTTSYQLLASVEPVVAWTAGTGGVPTVTTPPLLGSAVPGVIIAARGPDGGIELLDAMTGRVTRMYPVDVPAGSLVYPFGSGFVAAGNTTTVFR
jgi:PQQ-like domain